MTKNNQISLRMNQVERNTLDSLAKKLGVTNTQAINVAVLSLYKSVSAPKKPKWTASTKLSKDTPRDTFKNGVLSIKNVSHEPTGK